MTDFFVVTESAAETEVRRSKFLAFSYPVTSEEQLRERLAALKKAHHGAAHVVYAAILDEQGSARFSDDGEPSGTAGRPILDVLNGAGCRESMVAVVRYFGGVKLGTGGLSRAYGEAAQAVLKSAELRQKACRDIHTFSVSLALYNRVRRGIEQALTVLQTEYGERVKLTVATAKGQPLPDLYGLCGESVTAEFHGTQYIYLS